MKTFTYNDILSQYSNPRMLKAGGQKVAYRVDDPVHQDAVLKIGTYSNANELERIKREVEALRSIVSDYYPKNYDFEMRSGSRFIILEEYIDSQPLSQCLTTFSKPHDMLALLKSLVIGLTVLWDRNIIHRDIKPDNILITPTRQPKIIDLGIARLLDLSSLTNSMYGGPCTPPYAAPEQLVPKQTPPDWRTDQFALGIIALQLLQGGVHPFDPVLVRAGGDIPQNIHSGRWYKEALLNPALVPVAPLIVKLLGQQPHQRYRTVEALTVAIDRTILQVK